MSTKSNIPATRKYLAEIDILSSAGGGFHCLIFKSVAEGAASVAHGIAATRFGEHFHCVNIYRLGRGKHYEYIGFVSRNGVFYPANESTDFAAYTLAECDITCAVEVNL